ncbi:MAG TPA: nuclear transport factor 2 family protein [Alphaproteobacteria bacterium]|nr:nuclear transport factor 2 family protein [Alphaproteobacteria bacterium]
MDPDREPEQQFRIRGVIERYFNAVDRRDWELLAACFTEDVAFEFNLDTVIEVRGRTALVERMSGMPKPAASNHALSSTSILVEGDEATAVTFATASVVLDRIDGGRVLVRGLRYDDKLKRVDGAWRIAERRHLPVWQYETVSVPPRAPQRP